MNVKGILKRVGDYASTTSERTGIAKPLLEADCIFNCLLGRCTVRDYFIYSFYYLNGRGKRRYISNTEMVKWNRKHSRPEHMGILDDKERALDYFDDLVSRRWCSVGIRNSDEEFDELASALDRCILKPLDGTCGEGIEFVRLDGLDGKALKKLCTEKNALAEELIVQHPKLNEVGRASVNTLRIATLNGKVVAAVLRMGLGGSRIDNFSAGGIIASVDIDTGRLNSKGYTQTCEEYELHPDTQTEIYGFEVPMWAECKVFAERLAQRLDGIPFVGWDVAVTESGPVFVEGNEASEIAIYQLTQQKGMRYLIE